MAEIQPFRAYRYDLGRVGALSDVIAPPYDVIDEKLFRQLREGHSNNIVHVDLPQQRADDRGPDERYARAGRQLKDWLNDGVLKQDTARGFYVYHQEFEVEGRKHLRKGFLARVKLEPPESGVIQPHEETFAGPKLDRLKLMEATRMNLSPVFGMFSDAKNEVQALLDDAIGRQPPCEAVDHLGVVGRIWPVTDQQVLSQVSGLLGPKSVLIADGHHRYETCLTYCQQSLGAAANESGVEPARYTLMMLVGMSDPGLLVLPTHRLVRGLKVTSDDLANRLQTYFDVTAVGAGSSAAQDAWDRLQIEVGQGGLAFGTSDGRWLIARPRDLSVMTELAADHTSDWQQLSFSVLHRLVLGKLFPPPGNGHQIHYVHLLQEVLDAQKAGACDLAALAPPVSVEEVARIAGHGERMPQKSTYFYPKLQTGLVINSLVNN